MKNPKAIFVLQYILVLGLYRTAHAQTHNYNYKRFRRNNDDYPSGISLSMGASQFFYDKTNFDAWASSVYHKSVLQNPLGIAMDITFVEKGGDLGFHVTGNDPCALLTFFGGVSLCHRPHFCSYLNGEVGFFQTDIYNAVPPNYVPSLAQQQHNSYLRYQDGCVGVSLKNMFVSWPNKNGTSFISSLDFQLDYMPFKGTWEYGYVDHYRNSYTHSSRHSYFNGNRVSGIPAPANLYFSVTFSIGFLAGNTRHNRY